MAYDANGARIGAAGHFASRITAALIAAGGVEPTEEAAADTFANLTEAALLVLNAVEGTATQTASNVIAANFPGTTAVESQPAVAVEQPALRIIGGSGADHPAWLFEQAAKKGVTAVYDNRGDLAGNPKRPWYKQAEPASDKPAGFWPPR